MTLWIQLLVGGFLWAVIITGLVYVVRDCMKEQHQEPFLLDTEEVETPHCCGQGCVESLDPQAPEVLRKGEGQCTQQRLSHSS